MKRDVAVQANCLICDTHFVFVVTSIPFTPTKSRKGTHEMDDLLSKLQKELYPLYRFQRCPTCTENISHKTYAKWLDDSHAELHFSLCKLYSYAPDSPNEAARLPPLYLNPNKPEEPEHWELVYGIGPPTLELDRSHSGRIHKASLVQYGVTGRHVPHVQDSHRFEEIVENVYRLSRDKDRLEQALPLLERFKPILENWDAICDDPVFNWTIQTPTDTEHQSPQRRQGVMHTRPTHSLVPSLT